LLYICKLNFIRYEKRQFYIEYLVKILWWSFYTELKENTDDYGGGGNIKILDTLEDAKKYVESCKIKYHKI
jgi:hypothetical protein